MFVITFGGGPRFGMVISLHYDVHACSEGRFLGSGASQSHDSSDENLCNGVEVVMCTRSTGKEKVDLPFISVASYDPHDSGCHFSEKSLARAGNLHSIKSQGEDFSPYSFYLRLHAQGEAR